MRLFLCLKGIRQSQTCLNPQAADTITVSGWINFRKAKVLRKTLYEIIAENHMVSGKKYFDLGIWGQPLMLNFWYPEELARALPSPCRDDSLSRVSGLSINGVCREFLGAGLATPSSRTTERHKHDRVSQEAPTCFQFPGGGPQIHFICAFHTKDARLKGSPDWAAW